MNTKSLIRPIVLAAIAAPWLLLAPSCSRGDATAARLAIQLDEALKEKKTFDEQNTGLTERLLAAETELKALKNGGSVTTSTAVATPTVFSEEELLHVLQAKVTEKRGDIIAAATTRGLKLLQIGLPVSITIPEIVTSPYSAVITLRLQQAGTIQDVAVPVEAGWDGQWRIPDAPLSGLANGLKSGQDAVALSSVQDTKQSKVGIRTVAEIKNSDFGVSSQQPPEPQIAPVPQAPVGPKPPPPGIIPVREIKDGEFRTR